MFVAWQCRAVNKEIHSKLICFLWMLTYLINLFSTCWICFPLISMDSEHTLPVCIEDLGLFWKQYLKMQGWYNCWGLDNYSMYYSQHQILFLTWRLQCNALWDYAIRCNLTVTDQHVFLSPSVSIWLTDSYINVEFSMVLYVSMGVFYVFYVLCLIICIIRYSDQHSRFLCD